ncbi:hypothetical protein DIPPA_25402 [Diplonema papillatum]|nr:hypothetical protein DIPPA_25402 [Diplonema papillatum]
MAIVYSNILVTFLCVFYQTVLFQAGMTRLAWTAFRTSRVWGPLAALLNSCGPLVTDVVKDLFGWVLIMNCITGILIFFILSPLMRKNSSRYLEFLGEENVKEEYKQFLKKIPDRT